MARRAVRGRPLHLSAELSGPDYATSALRLSYTRCPPSIFSAHFRGVFPSELQYVTPFDVAGSDEEPLVVASGLSRRFGGRRAVEDVSFTLRPGECLALFGPNGAGKTTLLRLLGGLLRPTSGFASVAGVRVPGGAEARAAVGIISHQTMLYGALTARENLEFNARLHNVRQYRDAAQSVLDSMRMGSRADTPVRAMSRGMQQRVSIARALVHGPRVLLLDEPFTGLDDAGAGALTEILEALRRAGTAMVLVTHNVSEGLALATHAGIMRDARLVSLEARSGVSSEEFSRAYRELVRDG